MIPSEEQLKVLQNPGPQTSSWLDTVKVFADYDQINNGVPAYNDFGQHDATLGLLDPARARRAADKIIAAWSNVEITHTRNETREYTTTLALIYSWVKPHLTPEQDTAYRSILRKFGDLIFDRIKGRPWGTRKGDSDEVVGHYGVVLIAEVTGDTTVLTDPLGPYGITAEEMRAEISRYVDLADGDPSDPHDGGEWVESADYNLGTTKLLIQITYALGIEKFPEVAAFLDEVADLEPWMWTPDHKERVEWGDDQTPHQDPLSGRVALLSMLIGTGHDKSGQLRWILDKITRDKPATAYWGDLYRALWFFNPDSPAPDTEPAPLYGFRTASVGLSLHRTAETLCQIMTPNPLAVDHQEVATDIRIYHRGEWIQDEPRGYAAGAVARNTDLAHGFGSVGDFGRVSVKGDANGCEIVWRTGGRMKEVRGDQNPPRPFLNEMRPTIRFTAVPFSLVRETSFDGLPTVPDFNSYYDPDKATIQAAPAPWQQIYHSPVEPEYLADGFAWNTSGGQRVVIRGEGFNVFNGFPVTRGNTPGNFYDSELVGWSARFMSTGTTKAVIRSTLSLAEAPVPVVPPVPPTPPPAPPVPPPPVPPPASWRDIAGSEKIEPVAPTLRKRSVWQMLDH